jgi:predicted AAA+ superfamily ATPase
MWIERLLEPVLLDRARTRPVVVLTGARQTGKTALAKRVFPKHAYVSLDARRTDGSFSRARRRSL